MTSFYLCREEDQSILVETSARFSVHFLGGIGEPFTAHDYIIFKVWKVDSADEMMAG